MTLIATSRALVPSTATQRLAIHSLSHPRRWTRVPSGATCGYSTSTSASVSASEVPEPPYDVLFCGTDSFAAASLAALISQRTLCGSLRVLTPADVSQKWGARRMRVSPVKQLALSHALPHEQVPSSEAGGMDAYALPSALARSRAAILLTCSFGHLIPDALLDAFPHPWQRINIHPSLLPQLRGAAPIQWALARRLVRSGVSIQTLEKGTFDTGRILAQTEFAFPPPIPGREAGEVGEAGFLEVQHVMAERAAELLVRTLSQLPTCWAQSWDQDEAHRSFAPKLKPAHSIVRWNRMQASDIVARDRAFSYLYPLSTTLHPAEQTASSFRPVDVTLSDVGVLRLAQLAPIDAAAAHILADPTTAYGSALFSSALRALVVKTTPAVTPDCLVIRSLKTAGKKHKSAPDWVAAYHDRAHPTTRILTFT